MCAPGTPKDPSRKLPVSELNAQQVDEQIAQITQELAKAQEFFDRADMLGGAPTGPTTFDQGGRVAQPTGPNSARNPEPLDGGQTTRQGPQNAGIPQSTGVLANHEDLQSRLASLESAQRRFARETQPGILNPSASEEVTPTQGSRFQLGGASGLRRRGPGLTTNPRVTR